MVIISGLRFQVSGFGSDVSGFRSPVSGFKSLQRMSLINDALKKAQKQRTGEAPTLASMPTIGGESPRHIARRTSSSPFNPLLIGLGAAGLLIVVVAAIFLLQDSSDPATDMAATPPVPAAPQPAASTPVESRPAEPAFVLPIAAPPVVSTPPATVASSPVPTAPAPQPEPAPAEPAPASLPPAQLEPRAMTYIDNIRVAGIRASASDSKVLMNDRVYRVGDTVDHELGLKLVGITTGSLTFEDRAGGQYTRNF